MTTAPHRPPRESPDSPEALSRRLATLLGDPPAGPPRLGVEHEYGVFEGDEQIDFGPVVDRVGFDGVPLHPTNPRAYQTPSGLLLMADGSVAEAATPPVPFAPGFVEALEQWAASGRAALETSLEPGQAMYGASTHISVEVDPDLNDELCAIYARTFAPALMLLLDRTDSPGLLVRPRPSRTELCGEFVQGAQLRAATAFAAGSVMAIQATLRGETEALPLPPALDVVVEPGRQRHGWYVDREAFGPDLYMEGRDAELQLAAGGTVSAQAHLEACWQIARATLARHGMGHPELEDADDVVASRRPLPSEQPEGRTRRATATELRTGLHERILEPAQRPGLAITPISGTWDYTAFEVRPTAEADARSAVVSIPHDRLDRFLDDLEQGELDGLLRSYLERPPANRILALADQTTSAGVFDSVSPNPQLLPADRVGVGPGALSRERPDKVVDEDSYTQTPASSGPGMLGRLGWLPIAGGATVVITVLAVVFGVVGGGGGDDAAGGMYSTADPAGDYFPFAAEFEEIANPTNEGDISGMFVAPNENGATVTVRFFGAAQNLQSRTAESLSAGMQVRRPGERIIDVLYRNDDSSKVSDVTPGISVNSRWSAVDTLVFELLGFTAVPGTEFQFTTIQEFRGTLSSDEVFVTIEGDGNDPGPGAGGAGGGGGDATPAGGGGGGAAAANSCQALHEQQVILELTSPDVQPTIPLAFSASIAEAEGFPTPALAWSSVPSQTTEIVVFVTGFSDESAAAYAADPQLWWTSVPSGGIRWTLSGIDPSATSLAHTSLSSPPPAGTTEHANNVQAVLVDGERAINKFLGPDEPGRFLMWTVFALCDPEPTGGRADYRAEWLQQHAIAIGWFITESDW